MVCRFQITAFLFSDNVPPHESQKDEDANDANANIATIVQYQLPANVTDTVTTRISEESVLTIKNQTLITSTNLYKDVAEDFWSIFHLNSSLLAGNGTMSLNLNQSGTLELPDDIADVSCSFIAEYGMWNLVFKYSREDLKKRFCKCTGMCLEITLAPDIRKQVHNEIYGALSDRNKPVFIAVVTVYAFLLLVGLTGKL